VTFSVGVASMSTERFETVDALLAAADRAMYRAKERGRNVVEAEPVDGHLDTTLREPSTDASEEAA